MKNIRKLETESDKQKKDNRKKLWIGIVLALILILSSAGYAFFGSGNEDNSSNGRIVVNNIKFTQNENGYWDFSYNGKAYQTIYNPLDVENITTGFTKKIEDYNGKALYFGINTREDIASGGNYELLKNMQGVILKNQLSCLSENCTEDYPIKDCFTDNVIIYKAVDENMTRIMANGNCITIYYAPGFEEKATDALLFKILEII